MSERGITELQGAPPYETDSISEKSDVVEDPPGYSCTIAKDGRVLRKLEMQDINVPAVFRHWHKIRLQLLGTLLCVYRFDNGQDVLVRKYSLAYAQVGLATDYVKRPNCIRVRVENIQFLMHLQCPADAVSWVEAIQCGVNVALDLDKMNFPHFASLARRRRRRVRRVVEGSGFPQASHNRRASLDRVDSGIPEDSRPARPQHSHARSGTVVGPPLSSLTRRTSQLSIGGQGSPRVQPDRQGVVDLNSNRLRSHSLPQPSRPILLVDGGLDRSFTNIEEARDDKSMPFTNSNMALMDPSVGRRRQFSGARSLTGVNIERAQVSILLQSTPREQFVVVDGVIHDVSMLVSSSSLSYGRPRASRGLSRLFGSFRNAAISA